MAATFYGTAEYGTDDCYGGLQIPILSVSAIVRVTTTGPPLTTAKWLNGALVASVAAQAGLKTAKPLVGLPIAARVTVSAGLETAVTPAASVVARVTAAAPALSTAKRLAASAVAVVTATPARFRARSLFAASATAVVTGSVSLHTEKRLVGLPISAIVTVQPPLLHDAIGIASDIGSVEGPINEGAVGTIVPHRWVEGPEPEPTGQLEAHVAHRWVRGSKPRKVA